MYREKTASFLSRLLFHWIQPIMSLGFRRPLEPTDLYLGVPNLHAAHQSQLLSAEWEKERQKEKPSLFSALHRIHASTFWPAGILRFIGDTATIVSPLLLEQVTDFVARSGAARKRNQEPPSATFGYILPVILLVVQVIGTFGTMHFFHITTKIGVKIRTELITEFSPGKIVNLMSTDTSRLDTVFPFLHGIWLSPIQILITLGLLIRIIGVSALAGFGIFLVVGPMQGWVMKQLITVRKKAAAFTDKRVKLTQEMLQGIRIIKFFTWESSFLKSLGIIRDRELFYVKMLLIIRTSVVSVSLSIPMIASVVSLIVYSALGNELSASVVFSALALFNAIRVPLLILPAVISMTTDALVSLRRIEQLLVAEELEGLPEIDKALPNALEMTDGQFVWESMTIEQGGIASLQKQPTDGKKTQSKKKSIKKSSIEKKPKDSNSSELDPNAVDPNEHASRLYDINITIPRGKLVAVVGQVGSGKSSLLGALVGEMKRERGSIKFGGRVGYCPQTPWIQNATAKQNILFGLPYDEKKYRRVIKACALERDFQILPDGDETEIGERGITLSGGQKQRLNIARAVYFDPDVILLDDPLSAVDAHVGRYLFEKCVLEKLKGKTRILVTHQLHFLPQVDQVIVMDKGRIVQNGTYSKLMENEKGLFHKLMMEYGGIEKDDSEVSDDDFEVEETATGLALKATQTKESAKDGLIAVRTTLTKRSTKPEDPKAHRDLMTKEERATGAVAFSVYVAYFRAGGGIISMLGIVLLIVLTQLTRVGSDLWLSWWSGRKFPFSEGLYMGGYAAWGVAQMLSNLVLALTLAFTGIIASRNLHSSAMFSVFKSPVSFFDTTPLGRIINRFSKDVDAADYLIVESFRMFFGTFGVVISTFIFIVVVFPIFLAPLVPLLCLYFYFQLYYRSSSRELKRLDSITRSPLIAHFSESLTGLATIRAYRVQDEFIKVNEKFLDYNNNAYYLSWVIQRWLGLRLEMISTTLTFFVMLFAIISRFSVDPGFVGLVIAYSLQVSGLFTWMVRQAAEVEMNMNSVERLDYYAKNLEHEAPAEIPEKAPPADWPATGSIVLRDVDMRYRPELPLVLNGISLEIHGGEKIGVVGRTGSGKSSIMMALFRMVEVSGGNVYIDDIDVGMLGLKDLRSRLAIIPQDPILFNGSFRSNLDPLGKYNDDELWDVLKRVEMQQYISEQQNKLDAEVAEGGENLSAGQRQLVCLARAMLTKAKIIVMDEATASVDMQTDALLQRAIRDDFNGCTILTIAHRLNTVIDYDRVLVLDAGRVVEFGSPRELLENPTGAFTLMVDETGPVNAAMLKAQAQGIQS